MILKLVLLAIVVSSYAKPSDRILGEDDYLPCEYCQVPKDEYPTEGRMACYLIKRTTRIVRARVRRCSKTVCNNPLDFTCIPRTKCNYVIRNVSLLDCHLQPRQPTKEIDQRNETYGTIYQINSPHYFGYKQYPNSTYCIWNIADKGIVTYRIVDQRMQNASDCDGPGCDCPDSMKVSMGTNTITLCGSKMPPIVNQMSTDGLQVKFCADNAHSDKGVLLMAYRHTYLNFSLDLPNTINNVNDINNFNDSRRRRRQQEPDRSCEEIRVDNMEMSGNMSEMGCQYEYMMRMAQPGVPCPDDKTLLTLWANHEYMMTDFKQTMPMCNGMEEMSSRMPMMNSIESCAVDYLYRTRDCEFAKKLLDSTNGELNDVARMIAENNFPIKLPRWAEKIERVNCKRDRNRMDN